ncbi:RDD family protein [Endozoicomonas sp. OPT23]|uniref:RDD family protein n=1 Tax=Endozoicomonas sp. OPT23 TaxID=2072845 RepID=UPI00129A6B4B|nr:RDD family protein [Endozoicomonas sp. OPT23]MRI35155.1 RDD family protein [Endozoicomonas sp. OPT23]
MTDTNQAINLEDDNIQYAGFLARLGAVILDTLFLIVFTVPLTYLIYGHLFSGSGMVLGGWDLVINWLLPAVIFILFWHWKGATPGKMLIPMKVVDLKTGLPPSVKVSVIRYFSYFASMIPFFLGFAWIAFDRRKQGLHDKLAGTVVIRLKKHQE